MPDGREVSEFDRHGDMMLDHKSERATLPNLSPGKTKPVVLEIVFGHMSPIECTLTLDASAVIKPDDQTIVSLFKSLVSGKFEVQIERFGLMQIRLIPDESLSNSIDQRLEEATDWDDDDQIEHLKDAQGTYGAEMSKKSPFAYTKDGSPVDLNEWESAGPTACLHSRSITNTSLLEDEGQIVHLCADCRSARLDGTDVWIPARYGMTDYLRSLMPAKKASESRDQAARHSDIRDPGGVGCNEQS